MIIPVIENIPLEKIAVFPDLVSRAISRVAQNEIIGSMITTYIIRPPINVQVPNSSGDSLLVTIIVNTNPVTTPEIEITKEIKPEYVTLILDSLDHIFTNNIAFMLFCR